MADIFLTGVTGYIGGSVTRALLANGHRVRGLTRESTKIPALRALGVDAIVGTLDDTDLLTQEARGSDAVIHTASADHAGAVDAILAGLRGSGKAFLHTSGISVLGDDARGNALSMAVFDETSPLVIHPGKQARYAIDRRVIGAATDGVRSAVICPGLIYGEGRGLGRRSVQLPLLVDNALAQGVVQIVGAGLNVWSTVHIDDVVDLFCLALQNAPAGAYYFAEDGEASFAEMGRALADRLGLPGVESIDAELAAARWGEARAYFSLGSNCRVRASRARSELGWTPRQPKVLDWIRHAMPRPLNPTSRP